MDRLTEEINKKHGFLYKVDNEYYYMGNHIFKKVDERGCTTIKKYNEYLEYNDIKDNNNARERYRAIIRRSNSSKSNSIDIVQELDEFIKRLDNEQYNNLKQQVNSFSELYSKYGL